MPQNEFDVLLHRALLGACEERRLHFHEWEMYHMPDEGGQLECSFEENQVDDGEQKLRPVKPEELVTRMQQNAHQGGWNASILQREGGYHMLQLRSYGENHHYGHKRRPKMQPGPVNVEQPYEDHKRP